MRDVRKFRFCAMVAATVMTATAFTTVTPARAEASPSTPSATSFRSVPAAPIDVRLEQPDGSTFTARPWGDASLNGYEVDGFTIDKDPTGTWRYVSGSTSTGDTELSSVRPDHERRPRGIERSIRPVTPKRHEGPMAQGAPPSRAPHQPVTGTAPTLVILAQFTDRTSLGTTPADWAAKYFGSALSARDYYEEQSYGALQLTPAAESSGTANDGIVGWVTLDVPHPNSAFDSSDPVLTAEQEMIVKAMQAADPSVNFASYDTNGNGQIEARELTVTVIAAGYEGSYSGEFAACGPSVWGNSWSLDIYAPAPTLDGKLVGADNYMLFGEQHCESSDLPGHPATMGIIVHELGHAYELPDLYDTDGSSAGIGSWSLMAGGSWNTVDGQHLGYLPAGLDAFSKTYEGWVDPAQVAGTEVSVPLSQVATNRRIVQLRDNPGGVDWIMDAATGTGEYFLVENRQQVGYDAGLPGCGVLIWHIDETRPTDGTANNDETRPLVALEQADGADDLAYWSNDGDGGDPYPGWSANTSFNATSNPNSNLFGATSSGVSVTVPNQGCSDNVTVTVTAPGTSSPGMLRAPTAPAVPSQISVDGNIADTWGLNWLKVAPGSHEVCFGAVAGFTTPSCETVNVDAGLTTTVPGNFTARGYLRVTTSPPVASRISVDGIPRNNWGLYTDVPVGSHQVCFGAVAGFTPPACQTVNVTAGATTTTTGTFTASGASGLTGVGLLRVTTSPSLPSQITIDGNIADTWGLNWLEIAPGSHTVCFTRVEGYTTPACQTVIVTAGATSTIIGTFVTRGYLKVTTSPPVPGTISIDGHAANDWGVFTDIPVGNHQVCFGPVKFKTAPGCQNVTVTAGTTKNVTGTYS